MISDNFHLNTKYRFNRVYKALIGPANWSRVKAADLRVGDKVQDSFGYGKIRQIKQYKPKDPEDDIGIVYGVYLDDGRSFRLLNNESLTVTRVEDEFDKSKLSRKELKNIRRTLKDFLAQGYSENKMADKLSDKRKKLKEDWKADRVVQTEMTRINTQRVRRAAKKEDIELFKIILDPGACEECRRFTNNGKRIFTRDEMKRDGRLIPPHHVNCRCKLVPYKRKTK
jgi:SPP1 gp7 family putative phage head morphogenesis protein